jgi:hypothetical protein
VTLVALILQVPQKFSALPSIATDKSAFY